MHSQDSKLVECRTRVRRSVNRNMCAGQLDDPNEPQSTEEELLKVSELDGSGLSHGTDADEVFPSHR